MCDGVAGALCSVTVEASVKPHLWPLKISPHQTLIQSLVVKVRPEFQFQALVRLPSTPLQIFQGQF